jgi:hypothetical protein
MYTSIGLIILMVFASNSAVAASFGDDYVINLTEATNPSDILGSDDDKVCSVGTGSSNDGIIVVTFDDDFRDGVNADDVIIYGYDVDSDAEEYSVRVGVYEYGVVAAWEAIGTAEDVDGEQAFSMYGISGDWNCLVIITSEGQGGGGTWPGAEIDAVWVQYDS